MNSAPLQFLLEWIIYYTGLLAVLFLIISLTMSLVFRGTKKKKFIESFKQSFIVSLFLSYCLVFVYARFFKWPGGFIGGFHIVPMVLTQGVWSWLFVIISILVGVPIGFLMTLCTSKVQKWWIAGGFACCFSLIIEFVQQATGRGVFDIDDILFLMIGSLLGYLLFKLFAPALEARRKRNTVKMSSV